MDSVIQKIKENLDIVEVVSGYLKLQKTGINYRAICPFHQEKKPSFFVSPARQMFKCFGCGASGSIFDFVMKIEGLEFRDALTILAKRAGVELKSFKPELKTKRNYLYEICELSCRFFEKQLKESSAGKEVKNYLLKRGISEDSIFKWRLGYAPEKWRTLSDFLVGRGYKREEIVEAGLAVKPESNLSPYDRFRGRIIFPVFDLHSQVIGFGARVTEQQATRGKEQGSQETAKYINTPATLLYDKSRVLYGLNFAKMDIRKKNHCILTEGYTDVILSHQAGFENTIAASGTALTSFQLKILKRYASNLLTAFDMDVAGDMATQRGIDLAQREDFEVKVINMPKDCDPADIIAKDPNEWADLIGKSQEIMNFYFQSAFLKSDKEAPQGKKEIAKFFLPKIKNIANEIVKAHWIQKLSRGLKIPEEAINEELKKERKMEKPFKETQYFSPELIEGKKTRKEILEEKIVSLVLNNLQNLELIGKEKLDLFSPKIKEIFLSLGRKKPNTLKELDEVFQELEKEDEKIKEILCSASFLSDFDKEKDIKEEIKLCLSQLEELDTRNRLEGISKEIKTAEEEGDRKRINNLIEEFNQLTKTLTSCQKDAKKKI